MLKKLPSRSQEPLSRSPYDHWLTPEGKVSAEFFRTPDGFIVRFPEQVDFVIDFTGHEVSCIATPGQDRGTINDIYVNSILPILGNHTGELNLHGSATTVANQAIAFMGLAGRGKTTLVAAFARAGHAFLSEDVLTLRLAVERYWVQSKRPVLRLFPDSAAFLSGQENFEREGAKKAAINASPVIPHRSDDVPLARIYILGPGEAKYLVCQRLSKAEALKQLMQHAFILDVEDRLRLRSHFERVAELAESVPCYFLDFPRNYVELPLVVDKLSIQISEA